MTYFSAICKRVKTDNFCNQLQMIATLALAAFGFSNLAVTIVEGIIKITTPTNGYGGGIAAWTVVEGGLSSPLEFTAVVW
jgi:hypothetical protein